MRIAFVLPATLLLAAACAAKSKPQAEPAPLPVRPLASFAGRRVIVLPVRYLRPADSLGWAAGAGKSSEYLSGLDDAIAAALATRGMQSMWVFPPEISRTAKRNAAYVSDPHTLAADWLRPPYRPKPQMLLPDPLATQLRSLVALHDARYALLPVEVRFEPVAGAGRAVLHLVMLDARASQILWVGDVSSDAAASLSPAVTTSLAGHFADLIALP